METLALSGGSRTLCKQAFALSSAWPDICSSLVPSKRHWFPSHTMAHTRGVSAGTCQAVPSLHGLSLGGASIYFGRSPWEFCFLLSLLCTFLRPCWQFHMALRAPTPQNHPFLAENNTLLPLEGASTLLSPAIAWDLLHLQQLWGECKLGKSALAFSRRKIWWFPLT